MSAKKAAGPVKRERPFLICGIGCSAGRLNALETFFWHGPADCGIVFVVLSHQKQGHAAEDVNKEERNG